MRENRKVWIVERGQYALRHCIAIHAKARMDRADDVVEGIQNVGVVVDATVRENVGFDSLENPEVLQSGVDLVDLLMLAQQTIALQAASVKSRLRVIGDADVIPAALNRALGQLLDRRDTVGVIRMAVEDASQVFIDDEIG